MHGQPGVDFPETKAVVDLICGMDAGVSWVEDVTDDEIIITAPKDRQQRQIHVDPGERLDLVWTGPEELRALPAEVVAVETSGEPCWRLRATGPAGRGQRRAAVRATMQLRVRITKGTGHLDGVTVDVSEGGSRCILDAAPEPVTGEKDAATGPSDEASAAAPAQPVELTVGDVIEVAVSGSDGESIEAKAEVIRRHSRQDAKSEVSIRFIGLSEYQEDSIRRWVFAQLRDMRQRGLL